MKASDRGRNVKFLGNNFGCVLSKLSKMILFFGGNFFFNLKFGLGFWNSSSKLSGPASLSKLSRRTGISVTPTGVEWMLLIYYNFRNKISVSH